MKKLTLVSLQKTSFVNSTSHGFWDTPDTVETVPAKLALIHSELSEALEEFRKGRMDLWYLDVKPGREPQPEGFGIELADAVIRIADLAEHLGINLTALVKIKSDYNVGRERMHGKKV